MATLKQPVGEAVKAADIEEGLVDDLLFEGLDSGVV